MIEESGTVVAVHGDSVWVQTIRQSACQSCSARAGCGQRVLARMSGGRASQVLVANGLGARVGDQVVIGIAEQALMKASLLVYFMPLVFLVLAAVAADQWLGAGEGGSILAGLAGLAAGFGLVALFQRRHSKDATLQPRLLRFAHGPQYSAGRSGLVTQE